MSVPRVLVVDDEAPIVSLVRGYLSGEGMEVLVARDGPSAVDAVRDRLPDVVILDVMLPGLDGFEVLRAIRTFSDTYVIMLTARAEEIDRIVGLSVGADDYLVKPFSPRELVARVKALMRRRRDGPAPTHERIESAGLVVDRPARTVTVDGRDVGLTSIEFDLLASMGDQPGVVFSRQRLLDRVWGMDYVGDDHVVDVHVANLRRKLRDDVTRPRFIDTVRGVGYRFHTEASGR